MLHDGGKQVLAQGYFQPAQVDGGFNALSSAQYQDNAVPVLELNYSWPAGVGRDGRIDTVDARRGPHVIGAAHEVYLWCPKWAGADAADTQRIALALEV